MASTQKLGFKTPTLNEQMKERRRLALEHHRSASARMEPSVELPDRFKNVTDDEDEGRGEKADHAVFQKSILGVFSQAGRKPKLDQGKESESDNEQEQEKKQESVVAESQGQRHRKKLSDNKLLKPLLKPIRKRSDSESQDAMSQSQFLPPREPPQDVPERPASAEPQLRDETPLIERKLQAQADAEMMDASTLTVRRKSKEEPETSEKGDLLINTVAKIFNFDEPEEVLAVWSCWYLEKVLLQGHLYVTKKHICFYAYLKKKGAVIKSGSMAKQGKRDPRYSRYWFTLKGDVLTYYKDASHLYFPHGSIDLRYAITASLAPEKGIPSNDTTLFTITTENRTYYFKADSTTSAKEWVKQLQRVIFRSHNDGDSVKISIPLDNVIDVAPAPFVDGANTVSVSTVDNAEIFAVEEYFFTFASQSNDALGLLTRLTENNKVKKAAAADEDPAALPSSIASSPSKDSALAGNNARRLSRSPAPLIQENVRKTLSPLSIPAAKSPRSSGEFGRASTEISRRSLDQSNSSLDRGRDGSSRSERPPNVLPHRVPRSPESSSIHESTDSFATTIDHPMSSPSVGPSDVDMSASVMLTGDGAFREPTLRMPAPKRTESESSAERLRNDLQDASRSPSVGSDKVRIQPPTRAHTEQSLGDGENARGRKSVDTVTRPTKDGLKSHDSTATLVSRATRPIAVPLNQASKVASFVRDSGKLVGSYLSSSPGIYYEKISGALAGGHRHYVDSEGLAPDDQVKDTESGDDIAKKTASFRNHFSLPESELLVSSHFASLYRVLPLPGKIYLGTRWFCYRSLLKNLNSKMVIPLQDILNVEKTKGYRYGSYGMVVTIKGHEEVFFEFGRADDRDVCVISLLRSLGVVENLKESALLTEQEAVEAEVAAGENDLLQKALGDVGVKADPVIRDVPEDGPPIIFDDGSASMLEFKPRHPMRITCLTIGSRGDVQPYIALCKGLIADGHHPKIATHAEFGPWIKKHGIDFAPVGGNPAELMALCVEYGMFTPKFITETNSKFRGWLDDLLVSAWEACQGSEVLIESPSAMAGIHIAEALGIPYFRAFTMPWTNTRAYPHAFAPLSFKFGGNYNIGTYTVFNSVFWQLTARQINSWRRNTMGIKNTTLGRMKQNEVPFLYNFSPNVVAPPLDFSAWVHVTGYWFLDESKDWTPPADLLAFIKKARDDKMKLVYIGFGSVIVSDSKAMTQNIVDAVLKADVRCILSKGWSDRLDAKEPNKSEVPLPPSIFQIASAPHDWLFQQIDAVVHHGGAGTTGASLRAGKPTIIKPFFGDQFFFSTRVEDIGVGIRVKHITPNALGKALWIATHDDRIRNKARQLGERIRAENGVQTAINALYRDMEYAKRLIKCKTEKRLRTPGEKAAEYDDDQDTFGDDEDDEGAEDEWQFLHGDEVADAAGQPGAGIGDPLGWEAYARQRRFLGAFGGYAAKGDGEEKK
jgi:sterol 3beta-glucosyltransferase